MSARPKFPTLPNTDSITQAATTCRGRPRSRASAKAIAPKERWVTTAYAAIRPALAKGTRERLITSKVNAGTNT